MYLTCYWRSHKWIHLFISHVINVWQAALKSSAFHPWLYSSWIRWCQTYNHEIVYQHDITILINKRILLGWNVGSKTYIVKNPACKKTESENAAKVSAKKRQMANAIPVHYRANLINMKFHTWMKMFQWNATMTDWYDSVNLKRAMLTDTVL